MAPSPLPNDDTLSVPAKERIDKQQDLLTPASMAASPGQDDAVTYALGETVGRYAMQKWLGRGGFGDVYLAWDGQLHRSVAIKVPRRDRFRSTEEEDQFFEEARTAAQLKHSAIVAIHDVGRHTDGTPFVVMDYVEGRSLEQVLKSERPAFRRIAEIVAQVAEAVQYAHDRGIVHRDLKPANILLDTAGRPMITDFGLARRWEQPVAAAQPSTPLAGTLQFIGPEVLGDSGPVGPAADVYALGVTMYQAMAGRLPFEGSPAEVIAKILHAQVPLPMAVRPEVPEPLQRICLKAMEARPEDRYDSARGLLEDLRRWLEGREVLARPRRYDAELYGKLTNHYTDIRTWHEQRLITLAEMDRLMRPYWFMMQEELPGRRLLRLLPWEALLIRLGGWFVLLGSLLWPVFYWEEVPTRLARVLAVGLPALGLNLAGWAFHFGGGRANARIFLAIGAMLVPLLAAVVLCEYGWLYDYQTDALELLPGQPLEEPSPFIFPSNLQLTVAAGALVAYSLLLLRICGNRIFAICLGIGAYAFLTGLLLRCGLKHWVNHEQVARALVCYLVLCALFWPGSVAWAKRVGKRQAAWLFMFFPVPFVLLMTALGWYGSVEWFRDKAESLTEDQTKNIWWIINGDVYWLAAILVLRSHAGFIRFWGAFFLFLVPVSLLLPTNLLFDQGFHVIGQLGDAPVTIYELLCCLFAVGLVVIGMKLSQATLAVPGLIGLGVVVFRVTWAHFDEYLSWPLAVTLGGAAAMMAAGVSWVLRYRLHRRTMI